ncbi:MAG: hypothetical protein ACAI44_25410 [Candidatus Sericytochromatia bacterium]
MALRIIRKSSSQSQVELIKGSGEGKPAFSLIVFIDSAASFEAFKVLLADPALQQAEVLVYKCHSYSEQIRSQLPALQQTTKLINESKPASWSLRLRTGIQEASSDICLCLPFLPEASILPLLSELVGALQQDPSLGMAGPALVDQAGAVIAAGQDVAASLPAHVLAFDGQQQEYPPAPLLYLYAGLPLGLWQKLATAPLQMPGVPLPLAAIRREAYLSLSWADQEWSMPWLAQDLALGLRQKQYRLAVVPGSLSLSPAEAAWLETEAMPEGFAEKWQPVLRQVVFELYRNHGWQQAGTRFHDPVAPAHIQAYLHKG